MPKLPAGWSALARPDEPAGDGATRPEPTVLATAIGGVRGMVDSSVPALVFVVANALGGLREAVLVAIAVGALIFALRLVRREPVTQAFYGFAAVAVAALLAARTGKAQAFFLPGIAINAVYGAAGLLSLVAGRPLAGYALAALDARYADWRRRAALRRVAALATLTWTLVFALRVAVQGVLYLAGSTGWLAVAKIGMGWPLTGLAVAATLWLLRRLPAAPEAEGAAAAVDETAVVVQSPGPPTETSPLAPVPPSSAAS